MLRRAPAAMQWRRKETADENEGMGRARGLGSAGRRGFPAQQGQVNVICSVQAGWCNLIQTVYAKTTGVKVNMSLKGSGEALAQLIAGRPIPRPTSGSAAPATRTCRPPSRT